MAASSAASEDGKKRVVHIAFDIECTGQNLQTKEEWGKPMRTDQMVAVGWAADTGDKGQMALDLGKLDTEEWEEMWESNGWEKRCWDEFWSENEAKLDKMQDPSFLPLYDSTQSMMDAFVIELKKIEAKADVLVPWTDTTFFDTAWLTSKMMEAGYDSMMYRRDYNDRTWEKPWHGMQWGREVGSYIRGVYTLIPGVPKDEDELDTIKKKLKARIPGWSAEDAHYPMVDAVEILGLAKEAMKVASRRKEKEKKRRASKRQRSA